MYNVNSAIERYLELSSSNFVWHLVKHLTYLFPYFIKLKKYCWVESKRTKNILAVTRHQSHCILQTCVQDCIRNISVNASKVAMKSYLEKEIKEQSNPVPSFKKKKKILFGRERERKWVRVYPSRGKGRGRSRLPPLSRDPDVGLSPRTPGSWPEQKADA